MRVLGRYGEDHITFVSNARRWSVRCHGSHPVNSGMFWSLLSDIVAVVLVHHCDDVHTFLQNIKWAYLARHISYLFMITWCKITCLDQALRCCSSGICVGDRGCPVQNFVLKYLGMMILFVIWTMSCPSWHLTNTMRIRSPVYWPILCHCQVAFSGFAEENVEQSPDHRKLNVWKPRAAHSFP